MSASRQTRSNQRKGELNRTRQAEAREALTEAKGGASDEEMVLLDAGYNALGWLDCDSGVRYEIACAVYDALLAARLSGRCETCGGDGYLRDSFGDVRDCTNEGCDAGTVDLGPALPAALSDEQIMDEAARRELIGLRPE